MILEPVSPQSLGANFPRTLRKVWETANPNRPFLTNSWT
jgi:hypothetical protein